MPIDFNQYSTAKPLMGGVPAWAQGIDAQRLGSYTLYEMIYWNVPQSFNIIQRGSDTKPIYIPCGKQIVETLNRFLAPGFNVMTDPTLGTPADQANATTWMTAFLRREKLASRFAANKRYGIIRGDWLFQILGDPEKPAGGRVSVLPVDPGSYFPINNPNDIDEVIGCMIVDQVEVDGKARIFRTAYRKTTGMGGPSPITVEEAIFEPDAWGGPEMNEKTVAVVRPPTLLPAPIDQLPVYHIQNFNEPNSPWGSSELRGFERIIAAVNQTVSDEDLSVILEGLGVYWTTAGTPINAKTGEPAPWALGPGKVIELPGNDSAFGRVSGISSLQPFQDHIRYLQEQLDVSSGIPGIAKGSVDVAVAESGVALALELGPILAKAQEKEQVIVDVLTNLFYDLRNWFSAYEQVSFGDTQWLPFFKDPVPPNRKQQFDEIVALMSINPPVVSAQWAREQLANIGFNFPDDTSMMSQILDEQQMVGQVQADIVGSRIDAALANVPPPPAPVSGNGSVPSG